jgi:hypothetical protein
VRSIYSGFSVLEDFDASELESAAGEIESALSDLESDIEADISLAVSEIEGAAQSIEDAVDSVSETLRQFVAFVKTFQDDEFGTIYCEREWRALKAFSFSYDDLAMVVVPHRVGKTRYFDDFVKNVVPRLKLPRSLPIVPWEDLVEH